MKKIFTAVLIFLNFYIFSDQIKFINELTEKEYATISDLVISFCYLYNIEVSEDFNTNVNNPSKFINKFPKNMDNNRVATIGDFSLFAAQYLNLKSGLFYLATKSGRYAARELMLINIIQYNTSEFEKISGEDLLKYLEKVIEYEEKD